MTVLAPHWLVTLWDRLGLPPGWINRGLRFGPKYTQGTFAILRHDPQSNTAGLMPVFYKTAEVARRVAARLRTLADGNNYAAVVMPDDFIILDEHQRRLSTKHVKNTYGIFCWNQAGNHAVRIHIMPVFYKNPADAQQEVDQLRTLADGNKYAAVVTPIDFIVSPERPDEEPHATSHQAPARPEGGCGVSEAQNFPTPWASG